MAKNKPLKVKGIYAILIGVLSLWCVSIGFFAFRSTHFLRKTEIGGISCQYLSIEEAIQKINQAEERKNVTFSFKSGEIYDVMSKELGTQVTEDYIVQIFENQHSNLKESRRYEIAGFTTVNVDLLKGFLEQIPELQNENMIEPQDAYILWDGTKFFIQKERLGNVIDFEKALEFALAKINSGENHIDFSEITIEMPETLSKDLETQCDELNSILNSSITFELVDGSTITLDSNIIKNWMDCDENGDIMFDIEKGVANFVEDLEIRVNSTNSKMEFKATDLENPITIDVPVEVRAVLDKEKEIAEIKSLLCNDEPIFTTPVYSQKHLSDMLTSYVEVDISRQQVWIYIDGELFLETPCVTGNINTGNGTPTGVFFLLNKNRKVKLEGLNNDGSEYSTLVEYWMRFFKGCGFHDGWWRSEFGGNIYLTNGSHGCINLPPEKAAEMYEVIDSTMPIIIYFSQL